mgnify:CR=1 FL=1
MVLLFKSFFLNMYEKEVYTLGLCTMGTSSAALFKNGILLAAIEEERLSRKKNDNSFPNLAIKEVLKIENIKLSDVDKICVYWQPWRVGTRIFNTFKKVLIDPNSKKIIIEKVKQVFTPSFITQEGSWADLFRIKRILTKNHGELKAKINFYDHHLTHQKYGESIRSWDNCICLSYDGGGESDSTVLSIILEGKKKILTRHKWPNSLGHFYSTFTGFLGFKMLEGEYKMMGLAPYGKPKYKKKILSEILLLRKNGKYKLNTELCDYHSALKGKFNQKLISLFGNQRLKDEKPTQDHIDLACSVQSAFEDCLIHILSPATKYYPKLNKIVLSGGCALNVTANGKLLKSKIVDEIIIPPAPHDAGCAIGAALCGIKTKIDYQSVRSPYLGKNFSNAEIHNELSKQCKNNFLKIKEDDLIKRTVNYLIEGKLIAWFQGGAEFGPRALGARSFLADPRNDQIRDQINQKIKKRELFRPFAPSTLEETSKDFFDIDQDSPYMNIVSKVKNNNIPAVTHIDGTARVHTISQDMHNRYYKLISHFGKKTGIPVILNTSFNVQEPIVYSPKDAISTFINSKVDFLVIGDYIVSREDLNY